MTTLIQTRTVIRALTLSTLLAATATAYAASPAPTSTKVAAVTSPQKVATAAAYDGNWSVVIITEKGTCDRTYRYLTLLARLRPVVCLATAQAAVDVFAQRLQRTYPQE